MKRELINLVAIIVIFCAIIGNVAALKDMLIGREFSVEGVGVINSDLEISTQKSFNGIELSESISTPGGGFIKPSEIQYYSAIDVGMFNMTGNSSGEVECRSTLKMYNIKRSMYLKNYDLGAVMGLKTIGGTEQEVSYYSEDSSMETAVSGNVSGKLKLFQKVVDVSDRRTVLMRDEINLKGAYVYEWNAFLDSNEYPASDEGSEEWLGCP